MSRFSTVDDVRTRPRQRSTRPILTDPSAIGGDEGQVPAAFAKLFEAGATIAARNIHDERKRSNINQMNQVRASFNDGMAEINGNKTLSIVERDQAVRQLHKNTMTSGINPDNVGETTLMLSRELRAHSAQSAAATLATALQDFDIAGDAARSQTDLDFIAKRADEVLPPELAKKVKAGSSKKLATLIGTAAIVDGSAPAPVGEAANAKFIANAQALLGLDANGVADIYATNPALKLQPIPKALEDAIAAMDPAGRNAALMTLQHKDGTGDEADILSRKINDETFALFSATSRLDPADAEYQKKVKEASAPGYAAMVQKAKVKSKGKGVPGGKNSLPALSVGEMAIALGMESSAVSQKINRKFTGNFWHEVGASISDPKSSSDILEVFDAAITSAGSKMISGGIVQPVISGRPVSQDVNLATPGSVDDLRSVVARIEGRVTTPFAAGVTGAFSRVSGLVVPRADVEFNNDNVAGAVSISRFQLANPSSFFGSVKVLVDQPIISNGTQYIPIKKGNPTIGFLQWNPSGKDRVIMVGTDEFNEIVAGTGVVSPGYSHTDSNAWKWREDYPSTIVSEVDGPDSNGIDAMIQMRTHQGFFELEGRIVDQKRTEDVDFFKVVLATILDQGGWTSLSPEIVEAATDVSD